ncbi:MAG: hypothetical protein ABIQ01_06530 [Pseudolysinimonas sp.]
MAPALMASILLTACVTSCTAAPTPTPDSASAVASAKDVCWELSNLGTLVYNMERGKATGRIPGEEFQGAMYLAVSMLDRIHPSDDTDVNSALDRLKAAAGTYEVDPGSTAWRLAFADVSESCGVVLGEFGVTAWVSG